MIISAYSRRIRIVISLVILIPVGFYTNFYRGVLAQWLNNSFGGIFYEIFWCLLIFLIAEIRPTIIALSVLIATCCLEFLQLWHPPVLEWLRSFFIGRTILGSTFDWWDFPYYFIGSGIGWLWMTLLRRKEDRIIRNRQAEDQLRDALSEKEVLLREIHHRVKNNLASLISLMELQIAHIREPETIRIFKQLQSQLMTMSLVHKNLYQAENLARISFGEYLKELINNVFQIFGTGQTISLKTEIGNVFLNIDTAIPCGLIINEIVSNALKYAFPGGKPCRLESVCEIYVMLVHYENDRFMLIIRDNGVGLPQDMDWRNTETLGLKLVNMLSRQIRAELNIDIHNGTTFKLIFAEQKSPDFSRHN